MSQSISDTPSGNSQSPELPDLSYPFGGALNIDVEAASCDLIRLVSMGYVPGVKKMLEAGPGDVNFVNEDGDTALLVAASRNDDEMMKLLIDHGADLDVGVGREYIAHYATAYSNQRMLNLIIGKAGNP